MAAPSMDSTPPPSAPPAPMDSIAPPLPPPAPASGPAVVSAAASPRPLPTDDDIEAIIHHATTTRPVPAPPPRDTRTQLFVGNLPYRVRWQDLKDLFRKAGTVLRADVSLGPDNRSRGYGTVLLASAEDAGRAIDMFNGYSWQTRVLEVRPDRIPPDMVDGALAPALAPAPALASPFAAPTAALHVPYLQDELHAMSRGTTPGGRTLFVGNLPFHCQWQDLKDLFRQAGTILRADVAQGPDGRSRGFGMVSYATDLDAERAVKMFNGYEYNGRPLKVHHDKFAGSSLPTTNPGSPMPGAGFHPMGQDMGSSMPQHRPFFHNNGSSYQFDRAFSAHSSMPGSPFYAHPAPQLPGSGAVSALQSMAHYQAAAMNSPLSRATADSPNSASGASADGLGSSTSPSGRPTNHPGSLVLPPPPPPGAIMMPHGHPISPYGHPSMGTPMHQFPMSPLHHHVLMTPHGLPPMTPSMPSFNYMPQASPATHLPPHMQASGGRGSAGGSHGPSPNRSAGQGSSEGPSPSHTMDDSAALAQSGSFHFAQTPSHAGAPPPPPAMMNPMMQYGLSMGLLSPGLPFSPGVAMTPFWGPGAPPRNPFMNPAVGAPVHVGGGAHPLATDAAADGSTPQSGVASGGGASELGYFPPVPDAGYFPLVAPPAAGTRSDASSGGSAGDGTPDTTAAGTEASLASRESAATSWHTGEDAPASAGSGGGGGDDLLDRIGQLTLGHARGGSRTLSMTGGTKPRLLADFGAAPPVLRGDSDPLAPQAASAPLVGGPYAFAPPPPPEHADAAPRAPPPPGLPVRHVSADALTGASMMGAAPPSGLSRTLPGQLSLAGLGLRPDQKRVF